VLSALPARLRHLGVYVCALVLLIGCGSPQAGPSSAAPKQALVSATGASSVATEDDLFTLEVPEGAAPAGAQMAIQPVSDPEPHAFSGLASLAAYKVTVGEQRSFDQPLTLRFGYDPDSLRDDIDPAAQLTVAYLDEGTQRWVDADLVIDTAAQQVVVTTDHLTLWSLFGLEEDIVHSSHPNFDIYFSQNLNAPALSEDRSGDAIFDFAVLVRSALVTAREGYAGSGDSGLKVPDKTRVYIDDWGADKTAEWGWFSKNIEIPVTYFSLEELQHDAAHELFHAVQNEYYNVVGMISNRWWMEATADYAAASIGTGHGLGGRLPLKFLTLPLNADDDDVHMYQVAYFVDYLSRQGVAFPALFKAVAASDKDPLEAIAEHAAEGGSSLPRLYDQFAYDLLFGGGVPREPGSGQPAEDMGQLQVDYTDPTIRVVQEINVPGPYATALAAYAVKTGSNDSYTVALSAIEPTAGVMVRYVINGPGGTGDLVATGVLEPGVSVPVRIEDGQTITFVATNSAPRAGYVTAVIDVQQGETSFEHSRLAPMYNDDYEAQVTFSLQSSHPFAVVEEIMSPNGETWLLHLRLLAPVSEAKPATFVARCDVTGLAFADPGDGVGRTPFIQEAYWYVPSQVAANEVTVTTTGLDGDMTRLGYEVTLAYTNSDGDTYQTGGAMPVMVLIDH